VAGLTANLFGHFSVQRNGRDIERLTSTKDQELFCYLLVSARRAHARETLASLLWPEVSSAQARKNLRQTLWRLSSCLEEPGQPERLAAPLLVVHAGWVGINKQDHGLVDCDVNVFDRVYGGVRGVRGDRLRPEQVLAVAGAVALYQGDLLEGWYQDWCIYERERLQSSFLFMLGKLAVYHEAAGDYERAIDYAAQILGYDRAQERTHQQVMRLYALAGDRVSALRQFDRCVAALREELDVAPSTRTIALREAIRADRIAGPEPDAAPSPNPLPAAAPELSPLVEVIGHLQRLQTSLAETQSALRRGVQAAESSLAKPGRGDIHV
jgi:DNA-binding SARP family transcriptional activator